jgi:hypothetical protein
VCGSDLLDQAEPRWVHHGRHQTDLRAGRSASKQINVKV